MCCTLTYGLELVMQQNLPLVEPFYFFVSQTQAWGSGDVNGQWAIVQGSIICWGPYSCGTNWTVTEARRREETNSKPKSGSTAHCLSSNCSVQLYEALILKADHLVRQSFVLRGYVLRVARLKIFAIVSLNTLDRLHLHYRLTQVQLQLKPRLTWYSPKWS